MEYKGLLPSDPLWLHTVEEWIRGFREQQLPNLPNVFYCRKCGIHIYAFPGPMPITHHHVCGSVVTWLDDDFWQRLSNRIKRQYRKDRLLFARLKAEGILAPPVPELHGPLAWVTTEWRKAKLPPGRPRNLEQQLLLSFWLHALARPQSILQDSAPPSKLPSSLAQRSFKKGAQPPCWRSFPPIMTLSGAIEVLTGGDLKQAIARRVSWRQRELFGGLSIKILMDIRSAFRKQWQKQFGGVPYLLSRREAERILAFQRNLQNGVKGRISGIKLRQ